MINRRTFLATGATAFVGLRAGAAGARPALAPRLAFSTLACPGWAWDQVVDFAAEHRYAALELRGLQDAMDLSERPEFAPARVAATWRKLAERRLAIACVSSSANMHEPDAAKRAAQLAEARRHVDVAQALGAPYVRVFGNNFVAGEPHEDTLARVAAGLRELGAYARPRGVTVLVESHGDFVDSPTLLDVLRRAASPAVALLWDAHHTFVLGREAPADTVRQLGRYIRHTHLKDSVPGDTGRRYVLTGRGDVPVRAQLEALARTGYRGYYTFEWEKRWHPEIEEPEVALAQFAEVARGYFAGRRAGA